ncbi:hypothetical protein NMY22_g13318 [Coprinellus aureogranulatus]|nr:hypothetical protein NMY22_g13318 [Coprinellus aureogranulatus]
MSVDASSRRGTYGRIPGLAALALLSLAAFYSVSVSASVHGGASTISSRIYHRRSYVPVWMTPRQEGGGAEEGNPEEPTPRPSSNATKAFPTGSTSTRTQTISNIESVITTTTTTRNTTSTVTRSPTPISTTTETLTTTSSTSSTTVVESTSTSTYAAIPCVSGLPS